MALTLLTKRTIKEDPTLALVELKYGVTIRSVSISFSETNDMHTLYFGYKNGLPWVKSRVDKNYFTSDTIEGRLAEI